MGEVATSHFLRETSKEGEKFTEKYNEPLTNSPDVWARLSILFGDLSTAENIYMEQGDMEAALQMYKKLHKWDEALRYVFIGRVEATIFYKRFHQKLTRIFK